MSMFRQRRDLFGGAITAELPIRCIDASEIRQIPDTQEVFLYPDSGISIIIEILERVEMEGSLDAAKEHFDSIAQDNDAEESTILENTSLENIRSDGDGDYPPSNVVLGGTQSVRKFNQLSADKIYVFMALFRFETKRIDLVMSMNVPLGASKDAVEDLAFAAAKEDFYAAASTLRMVDYGLFG